MPRKPPPRITAWSHSRWATYRECPHRLRLQAIDRVPEEKGPALIRGQDIHDKAERFTTGELKRRPGELDLFDEEFRQLRAACREGRVEVEQMLCLDQRWRVLDDPFGPSVWCRIKMDVLVLDRADDPIRATVIDHKTGRVRDRVNDAQLELYALGAFISHPSLEEIETELWYLDHGVIKPDAEPMIFRSRDVPRLKQAWEKRVKPMLSDRTFMKQPGQACRFCPYRASRGGPCDKG